MSPIPSLPLPRPTMQILSSSVGRAKNMNVRIIKDAKNDGLLLYSWLGWLGRLSSALLLALSPSLFGGGLQNGRGGRAGGMACKHGISWGGRSLLDGWKRSPVGQTDDGEEEGNEDKAFPFPSGRFSLVEEPLAHDVEEVSPNCMFFTFYFCIWELNLQFSCETQII